MSNRNYNVFFNMHTVSGIVISVTLYIIFFAGAFSVFKEEIGVWQEGKALSHTERENIDYDSLFNHLDTKYELVGRDLQLNFGEKSDKISLFMSASKDSLQSEKSKESDFFYVDINTAETKTYTQDYSLGEFLYRLHFLAQFPFIGIYLAGFVSLFFLFAIVTGVIVHWKKIIPNFYSFNPKLALKRVWTDAHTVLGFIGLPFQFVFAVTGAYFCLSILVLLPANFLYGGDQDKLLADVRPEREVFEWLAKADTPIPSFNEFAHEVKSEWPNFELKRGFVKNFGGTNMKYVLAGELQDNEKLIGLGRMVYDVSTDEIIVEKSPYNAVYVEDIQRVIGRLHFADFGGLPMKLAYFILALITCFVIITGVLIWVEARNKKSMAMSQRLFTAKVGHIYMAICLSMLPVTALSFLYVKLSNNAFVNQQTSIYTFYFVLWLLAAIVLRFRRDNYFVNKLCLLLGSLFGFLIPLTSGLVSGNWIWVTYSQHQYDILIIDLLWLGISGLCLFVYLRLKPELKEQSAFAQNPIDYTNVEAKEKAPIKGTPTNEINTIPMRTKIIILWMFLGLGWLTHHIYGLFNVYYLETMMMDGATGEAPLEHHLYRILFEGLCFLMALLTLELKVSWFKLSSFVLASLAGLYNIYHLAVSLIYELTNVSEIFMLALVVLASVFLVKNLYRWKK